MLNEELLNAYVSFSSHLKGDRYLDQLSYNEMAVCRILKVMKSPLTATKLSKLMNLHKSQINVLLKGLERKEMIYREVNEKDHRQVFIFLNEKPPNEEDHQELLASIDRLIDGLGVQKTVLLKELMEEAKRVLKSGEENK